MDITSLSLDVHHLQKFHFPSSTRERCGLVMLDTFGRLTVMEVNNAAASEDTFVILRSEADHIIRLHPYMRHVGYFHTHPSWDDFVCPSAEDFAMMKNHKDYIGIVYNIPRQTLVYYTWERGYKVTRIKNNIGSSNVACVA